MSEAIRFLHMLGQALSTMALYAPGHPATRRAHENAWHALVALLKVDAHPIFFFIGSPPVYASRAMHELRDWPFSKRLMEAGIQRLEFDEAVTQPGFTAFLDRIQLRLTTGRPSGEDAEEAIPGILYGTVAVEEVVEEEDGEGTAEQGGSRRIEIDLSDELEAMGYVLEAARNGSVARAEAEAVARILGSLIEEHDLLQVPFGSDAARYHLVHPVNTALLALAAARASGIEGPGRQRLTVAALLHDIGMTRIPAELVNASSLSAEERVVMETHPGEGARLLLDHGGRGLELAATVSYEHQLRPDGGGYPQRRFRPVPHWASRLIGTAGAYVALRAPRPYRPQWSEERALELLGQSAGTAFDAEMAHLVINVVRGA